MKHSWTVALLLLGQVWLGNAAAAKPDLSQCFLCHGTAGRGNPAVRAPRIAGMEPWYLKQQLLAYRASERGTHGEDVPGQEMRTIAAALAGEDEIDRIVAAVAALKADTATPLIGGNVARGESLYAGCAACHGARGEGNVALKAPALVNRSDWYQVSQLENFRSAKRGFAGTSSMQMRAAAAMLADTQAAQDVVAYINTLR